jgi:hypothetical protein
MQNITNEWSYSFTANNTVSIPVINIPSAIRTITVVYSNLVPATTFVYPLIQVSNNNGASYVSTGYASGNLYILFNSSSLSNQTTTSGFLIGLLTGLGAKCSATFTIYGINQAFLTTYSGTVSMYDTNTYFGTLGGTLNGTTGINAFQIIMSSGNITTGNFNFYGET